MIAYNRTYSCMQYTHTVTYQCYVQWHTAATTTELRLATKANSYNIGKRMGNKGYKAQDIRSQQREN
jgi:hypothetical protein